MRFIQISCREVDSVDLRQAKAVLQHQPDVILFEAPGDKPSLSLPYNKYPVHEKPLDEVMKHQAMLRRVSKNYPWVGSDIAVYDSIIKLWKEGHGVKLFHVDAASELLRETIENNWNLTNLPRRRGVHFAWWVYIYLRERTMANNLLKILPKLPKEGTVLNRTP